MDLEKKARLEAQGWRVGSAEELLGSSPEEAADVELRLSDASKILERGESHRRVPPLRG
jgi:hypothetical protein